LEALRIAIRALLIIDSPRPEHCDICPRQRRSLGHDVWRVPLAEQADNELWLLRGHERKTVTALDAHLKPLERELLRKPHELSWDPGVNALGRHTTIVKD
jgi:hypothetical protein